MSIQRIKSLLFRSKKIQKEIENEQKKLWPNWLRLVKLKKLRLFIKDSIKNMSLNQSHLRLQPARIGTRRSFKKRNQIS